MVSVQRATISRYGYTREVAKCERSVRVARGDSDSSFLSAQQSSQVHP